MAFLFEPRYFVPFESAWDWQRNWQRNLMTGINSSPAVWLLQHSSCYTLGRGASETNLLFDINHPPVPVYRIDRGGEVTHHLPGQLVVYPVLDLGCYKKDLNWYLRELEEIVIEVLCCFGLKGERSPGNTGLWLERQKVASIGIGCRRWITQHGLALNVNCDLDGFNRINPCGVEGQLMGSLNHWIPGITVLEVQHLMKKSLENRFGFILNSEETNYI